MYVVRNKKGVIVGYHPTEDVVFEYVLKYNKYSEDDEVDFEYVKDKKFYKYLKHNKEDDRKYLLRYNNTYIPEMYIDSVSLCDNGFIRDIKYARDTLDTLMSCYDNFSDKQMRQLGKAYRIMNEVITDAECYTPDIKQMNYNRQHISEMMDYNKFLYYDL